MFFSLKSGILSIVLNLNIAPKSFGSKDRVAFFRGFVTLSAKHFDFKVSYQPSELKVRWKVSLSRPKIMPELFSHKAEKTFNSRENDFFIQEFQKYQNWGVLYKKTVESSTVLDKRNIKGSLCYKTLRNPV